MLGLLGQGIAHTVHVNVSYALGLNTPFQTLGLPLAGGYVDFRLIPSVHCLGADHALAFQSLVSQ